MVYYKQLKLKPTQLFVPSFKNWTTFNQLILKVALIKTYSQTSFRIGTPLRTIVLH